MKPQRQNDVSLMDGGENNPAVSSALIQIYYFESPPPFVSECKQQMNFYAYFMTNSGGSFFVYKRHLAPPLTMKDWVGNSKS